MMINSKNQLKKYSSKFITTIIVVIIIYIIFNIGKTILANYRINEHIAQLESEINNIEKQNQYLKNLNLYYQTDSFKDIEARKKLGMKKPDEKMVVIAENNDQGEDGLNDIISNPNKQKNEEIPNYLSWWYFILGK